jgi:hypothetical protein
MFFVLEQKEQNKTYVKRVFHEAQFAVVSYLAGQERFSLQLERQLHLV